MILWLFIVFIMISTGAGSTRTILEVITLLVTQSKQSYSHRKSKKCRRNDERLQRTRMVLLSGSYQSSYKYKIV